MRSNSFYRAFGGLMANRGFRPTSRPHWSRRFPRGAIVVFLDLRPLSHDYEVLFGVNYSHRPHPDRLRLFECVAHGTPDGLSALQRSRWRQVLDHPGAVASDPDALIRLSGLLDLRLRTLSGWQDPRRLYEDLHRGRAVAMLVNWRRLIAACRRWDRAEGPATRGRPARPHP